MGVFYDVRAHITECQDDFTGKKGSTVTMGIRKVSVQNSADWQGEEASQ
jgi:hypothetical protein